MKLLALETSTDACSVALHCDGELLLDHRMAAQKHAQLLLPMIDQLLADAGIALKQLDGVAFGCGPGSFTGLRIAAATAQGLAYGSQLGVIPVSSLQALALGAQRTHSATHVLSILDARMGEVYCGVYVANIDNRMISTIDDCVCAPDDVPLPDTPDVAWLLVGSGADAYKVSLQAKLQGLQIQHAADCWPNAQDILTAAIPRAQRGEFTLPEDAVPVYLRNRVALTEAERASGERL